jgi:two-component system response regulator HydG
VDVKAVQAPPDRLGSTPKRRVLVVDDSAVMVTTISRYLAKFDFIPERATSAAQAIDVFAASRPDVVVTDLRMAEVDGLDLLEAMKRIHRAVPVIIMTAFGAIDTAVEAMRRGAFDYLTKPFELGQLRLVLERACRKRLSPSRQLIGDSPAMVALRDLIGQVAVTDSPVLILGETGTGKELVARAIHAEGPRALAPFRPVSCASLVEAALDRELFGAPDMIRGDGTATPGLFRSADGGTLFLDEIGDMSLALQSKLLRVLQEGEVLPGGARPAQSVDVRCICATNQDLRALVAAGRFREDLLYRLDVLRVRTSPLRERAEDIPTLIEHFLGLATKRTPIRLQPEALRLMSEHKWPGNVRELENVLERLVMGASSASITAADVRAAIGGTSPAGGRDRVQDLLRDSMTLARLQQRYVDAVLERENGNKTRAAEVLGVDVSTLYRRARRDSE